VPSSVLWPFITYSALIDLCRNIWTTAVPQAYLSICLSYTQSYYCFPYRITVLFPSIIPHTHPYITKCIVFRIYT
jgi:hypothetical protein